MDDDLENRRAALQSALDLPQSNYEVAASHAEMNLRKGGYTVTRVSPGDATAYFMMVSRVRFGPAWGDLLQEDGSTRFVHVEGQEYYVSCSLAGQHTWTGQPYGEPGYVADKYFAPGVKPNPWTVAAIYRFFNTLGDRLQAQLSE